MGLVKLTRIAGESETTSELQLCGKMDASATEDELAVCRDKRQQSLGSDWLPPIWWVRHY